MVHHHHIHIPARRKRETWKGGQAHSFGKNPAVVHTSSAYITLARVIVIQLYKAAQEANEMQCFLGTQIFYYITIEKGKNKYGIQ